MRRVILVALLALACAGGVGGYQRFQRNAEYRRLLATGDQALAAGDSYSAVEAFSGAIALRADSMAAYYRRGEAYRMQNRVDEAVRDLREASRLAPDATPPLVALGRLFDSQGQPAQAAEWYARAAARLQGEDPALLYTLGLARYRAGTPATAREPLERAVARHDAAPEALYLLGIVYRDLNDPAKAVTALERAVQLDRTLIAAREELADVYRSLGRSADELAQLQALLGLDPQPARRVAVALSQARQGQFDLALATLDDVARQSPDDSRVSLARGRVYLARAERPVGRIVDAHAAVLARDALERALGGTARRSEGLALYGRALFLTREYTEALRILREAATTSPVDLEAFAFLADAAEQQGKPLEASDALISLDALQGDTATPATRSGRARRIGMLSLQGSDARRAADYLKRAVDGGHDDVETLGWLAEAYWRAGDPARARSTLATALTREPNSPTLLRLSRTLIR